MRLNFSGFGLLFLCLLLFSELGAEPKVSVIRDDRLGFVFEVTFRPVETRAVNLKGKNFTQLKIPGLHKTGLPGHPALPSAQYTVGIPVGNYRVKTRLSGTATIPIQHLVSPNPTISRRPGGQFEYSYAKADRGKKFFSFPDGKVVETAPGKIKNQRVLDIEIFPIRYKPGDRFLNSVSRITVEIAFSGSGVFQTAKGFETFLSRRLLNYETAKGFRLSRRLGKGMAGLGNGPFDFEKIYKVEIRNQKENKADADGFYELTGADLEDAGADLSGSDFDEEDIRVYGPSTFVLDRGYQQDLEEAPPLLEIPISLVNRDGKSTFGSADEIRFYAHGGTRFFSRHREFCISKSPIR